ncbi:MAG: RluA family pseudouridine synthase [Opitutales bacterium]
MDIKESALIESLPLNAGVRVLAFNEDGLVALYKPEGTMSHPNKTQDIKRSLITASYDFDKEFFFWKEDDGQERKVWLIHRLDSPTSGIILIGLNEEISKLIKAEFSTHKVTKHYHALVRHPLPKNAGIWADTLRKDLINNGRKILKAHPIKAKSGFQLVSNPVGGFPISLIKLSPITGRTHQLRIQCSKHGHPIVGDRTYGSFSFNKEVGQRTGVKRMMLHSSEVILKYAFKGKLKSFHVKSDLPEAFNAVFRYRPGMAKLEEKDRTIEKDPTDTIDSVPAHKALLDGRRFKAV